MHSFLERTLVNKQSKSEILLQISAYKIFWYDVKVYTCLTSFSPLLSSASLAYLIHLIHLPSQTCLISWGNFPDIVLVLFTIYMGKSIKRKIYVVQCQKPKRKIYFRMRKKQETTKSNRILGQLQE